MRINKWIVRHALVAKSLLGILFTVSLILLYVVLQAPIWLVVILLALDVICIQICPQIAATKLINKALQVMQTQCDPFPLLKQTQELLELEKNEQRRQMLTIDHCAALVHTGDYQKVYDTLSNLNIDKFSTTLPFQKVVYYNNLADVCEKRMDFEKADLYYRKAAQIFADMKENAQKKALQNTMSFAKGYALFRQGDIDGALTVYSTVDTKLPLSKVESALLCARLLIAKGDTVAAKLELRYVMENGNRLYEVTVAKELYEQPEA